MEARKNGSTDQKDEQNGITGVNKPPADGALNLAVKGHTWSISSKTK